MADTSENVYKDLLKLRKGAAAWLKKSKLQDIFDHLDNGWKIEPTVAYRSSNSGDYVLGELGLHLSHDVRVRYMPRQGDVILTAMSYERDQITSFQKQLMDMKTDTIPDPKNKKSPSVIVCDVNEVSDTTADRMPDYTFNFKAMAKTKGVNIISPEGEAYGVFTNMKQLGYEGVNSFEKWFAWAQDNTNIMDDILSYLGMEPHVPRSQQPREAKEGQTLGTCAICDCEQVVKNEKMVLHGYQRPGYGTIVGDCFGAKRAPYELSYEPCVEYKEVLTRQKKREEDILANLKEDKVDMLYEVDRRTKRLVQIERTNPRFDTIRKRQILQAETRIKQTEMAMSVMDARIKNWKPGTLKTKNSPPSSRMNP